MQPVPNTEAIEAILSRFQTWAEKHPDNGNGNGHGNGNGAGSEEAREIPYEEAIRQHRSRREAQTQRRAASKNTTKSATPRQKSVPQAAPGSPAQLAAQPAQEAAPPWVAALPVVSGDEPVIDLKPPAAKPTAQELVELAMNFRNDPAATEARTKPPAPTRSSPARKPGPESPRPAPIAASPELPADSVAKPAAAAPLVKPARKMPPRVQPAKNAAPPPAPRKAIAAAIAARPQAKAAAAPRSAILTPRTRFAAASAAGSARARSTAARRVAKPRSPRRAQFRQVLANTMRQPTIAPATKKKPAPDRTRRITTRFTAAEERRIEKLATELGITVSAYLRQCALATTATQFVAENPAIAPGKTRSAGASTQKFPARTYSAPAPSRFGGWLALLRNRFVGPPVRFSEDA